MLDEPEKKKKGPLRLVSRKSTRKMLGKWKKLDNGEKSDNESFNGSIEETFSATLERRKVFGLPLREAVDADPSLDGVRLPSFFRYSIDFIEEHGLSLEGIYRVSPPKSRLDELERRANAGESLTFADAHDAAGLIKRFLRQLPEPLLPVEFERLAETCRCNLYMASTPSSSVFCRCGAATAMRDVFASLEVERSTLTTYVFLHARHVVQNERENKMGIPALGLLLQTILDMSRKLVCFCLNAIKPFDDGIVDGASYILDADAQIFKYIPPRAAAEVETWVCEDLKEVRGELRKQNCLLDVLHNKISARHQKRLPTRSLDEQLWQVQCAITVLKRRVKQFPEPPPVASVTQVDPCCAEIYEEKQLMATQGMLREDLVDEQRRIALLCWKLRELGVESPRVFGMASLCNSTDSEEATSSSTSADVDENSLLSAEEREWKERCRLEDAARSALLGEIVRLRNECAVLRAKIEMTSQGVSTVKSATTPTNPAVFVSRF